MMQPDDQQNRLTECQTTPDQCERSHIDAGDNTAPSPKWMRAVALGAFASLLLGVAGYCSGLDWSFLEWPFGLSVILILLAIWRSVHPPSASRVWRLLIRNEQAVVGSNADREDVARSAGYKPPWAILALLRFVLASNVVINHHYFVGPFEQALPWPEYIIRQFGGFASVLGFFVISGYSIAYSIESKPEGFYRRRFQRLYPSYLACFIWALIPFAAAGTSIVHLYGTNSVALPSGSSLSVAAQYVFTSLGLSYLCVPAIGTLGVTWSLTCEIVYYALAPAFTRLSTLAMLALIGFSAYFYLGSIPVLVAHNLYGGPAVGFAWA